ncbi:MAG: presqualene diphosphate synthase HpnD [Alphaproteobacteria bacterium]|jgi:squalene synthase HpnD
MNGEADDLRHVHDVVRRSGSSFLWGMRILPKPRREAMYAIYAFCREVDDIADEPGLEPDKRAALQEWRAEIDRIYAGNPKFATGRALLEPVRAFELPREEFLTVIDGMETDAGDRLTAMPMDELLLYCRRVAGAVGMLSIHAFGATKPPAPDIAISLGNALQLTNILRDVGEDAARDRLYLPRELLAKHGVEGDAAAVVVTQDKTAAACAELAGIARGYFAETDAHLTQFDWRQMRPAILMMEVYRRTLDRLEARGWENFRDPIKLSRPEKLWVAFRYSLF